VELTRRSLFHLGGAVGAGLLAAACSGSAGAGSTAPAGPPRTGGTLRVGALGKASALTRDPHGVLSNESDFLITSLVYDALTVPGREQTVAARLAGRWEADAAQRRWRFTIADNARFHDGSPVTAEDVVWSLRRLRAAKSGATKVPVAPQSITADGRRDVVLESAYPNSQLPLLLRLVTFVLKKDTTVIEGAPGTGPFKLDWYRGGNARLVRNDEWHGGKPLLDAIEVTLFESPQAMSNALLGGQIDLASNVGPVAGRTAKARTDVNVIRRPDDMAMPIVMRVADGPFADPRVRQALRLAVDRDAMVEQVLSGYGTVGNDILGTGDPLYAKGLPQRTRDLAQARHLLDESGFDRGRTYRLATTQDVFGLAESAELFATQVREVGVNISVVKQDPTVYNDQTWLRAPLYTGYWGTNDSVVFFASKVMNSESSWNETAFHDAEFDAAYRKSVSTDDHRQLAEASATLQRVQYERGGYLLWGMADGIDLASEKVQGLPTLPGYGRVQLERTWLSN
jgi:peptide/nickel transport system substrate-binding protein